MDELTDIYKRIEYLRNNGVKMKEIADRVDMAPSVLSALYSSVLPAYIDLLKTRTPDEALDDALALVNNVSKKRLLNNVSSMRILLQEMEPEQQNEADSGNSFIKLLGKGNERIRTRCFQLQRHLSQLQSLLLYGQPENRTLHDLRFRKQ